MEDDDLLRAAGDGFIGDIPPGQTIQELFVWVATVEGTGEEGIAGGPVPGVGNVALVASKRATAERLEPIAREVRRRSIIAGQPVRIALRRFVDTGLAV